MDELAVVVNLSSEVRIVARGSLEDDFCTIREGVTGQVDFAEGASANYVAKGIVADVTEDGRREFPARELVRAFMVTPQWKTYSRSSLYELASCKDEASVCCLNLGYALVTNFHPLLLKLCFCLDGLHALGLCREWYRWLGTSVVAQPSRRTKCRLYIAMWCGELFRHMCEGRVCVYFETALVNELGTMREEKSIKSMIQRLGVG